ncbi:MAG: hypothetical protein AABY22_31450, partial [Nanoarchaeota archaeon]
MPFHIDYSKIAENLTIDLENNNLVEQAKIVLKPQAPNRITKVPTSVIVSGPIKRDLVENKEDNENIIEKFQNKENRPFDFGKTKKEVIVEKFKPSTEINVSGRKTVVIDNDIFLKDSSIFLNKDSITTNEVILKDSLRGRSGKFWSLNNSEKNLSFVGSEQSYVLRSPFTFNFESIHNDSEVSDFGRTFQVVAIEANKDRFSTFTNRYNKTLWSAYINGKPYAGSTKQSEAINLTYSPTILEDTVFQDHAFDMSLPLSEDELKDLGGQVGVLSAKIEPVYNFMIETYENTITNNKNVLENTLPNMYVMLSEMTSENPNPSFAKLISLDKAIDTSNTTTLLSFRPKGKNTTKVYDLKKNPIGEYFDLYGRQYQEAVLNKSIKPLSDKFSNLGISIRDIKLLNDFNDKKQLFPLYVNLKFSTDKTTTFTQILRDTGLLDTFTGKIIKKVTDKVSDQIDTQQSIEEIFQKTPKSKPEKTIKLVKKDYRMWDLAEILETIKQGDQPLQRNVTYLGDHFNAERSTNKPEFKFFKSLNAEIFHSKLHSLAKQKLRSYKDLIDGKLAYSETVMYRIAKFLGNDKGNEPIQNIFIPNATEMDALEYIDTQVRYDKRYTYVIYAYQFVVGNKYWYSNLETEAYNHHATFRVYQEPSMKLVEIPYFRFTGRVMDKPPAPPQIDFISYKGVDNKMLLLFNNSIMELKAQPVLINESDADSFTKIREAQNLTKKQPIKFGGDDRISNYEIYRLDKKPTSYLDFANNLRINLTTDVSLTSMQKASAGGVVDNLEPNKKFYYTFRAKDVHGHISNPTSLYEVQIINEHGTIFPLVKIIDFKEKIEKSPTKSMKRFVQIVPTIIQSLINEKASGFEDAKTAEEIKNKIALSL